MDTQWPGCPMGYTLPPHLHTVWNALSGDHISGIPNDQLDTPMMKQFSAAKDEVPDALVFFRMGDFYELFGRDAIIASDVCQITLTTRDKNAPQPVPMAGVPVVSHRTALKKCLMAGFKVAVCEQVDAPSLGMGKGLMQRKIVRIASPSVPGDLDDDDTGQLNGDNCYLGAVAEDNGGWALAYVDASTGEFRLTHRLSLSQLGEELQTVKPKEVVLVGSSARRKMVEGLLKHNISGHVRTYEAPPWLQRSHHLTQRLVEEFFSQDKIRLWGLFLEGGCLSAVGAILNFLKDTQRRVLQNIQEVQIYHVSHSLQLDTATKNNLDFYVTARGEKKGSLFHFMNQCKTAHGTRLLKKRMDYPFLIAQPIHASHARIEELIQNPPTLKTLCLQLATVGDLERLVGKAAYYNLDPRGMGAIRQSLSAYLSLCETLLAQKSLIPTLAALIPQDDHFSKLQALHHLLQTALVEDPAKAHLAGDPLIRPGFHSQLDELYTSHQKFSEQLQNLENREKDQTGITTLKIGFNRVYGYYFEVSKAKASLVPARFTRKQSLTTGERFVTPELKELEELSLMAQSQIGELEKTVFDSLRDTVLAHCETLVVASGVMAEWDLSANFAQLALQNQWVKPILDSGNVTVLEGSVHPVLQSLQSEPFVPNDIALGDIHSGDSSLPYGAPNPLTILLITGPNMAGKSTIMRQVALSQVLCQMGSYVPAKRAIMGLCDSIFSRLGAGDNATKQQSTFMVEMLECAHMLRDATEKSLLIMDEVGRGTSTHDGVAIAWAILEDLAHRVKCRALFSTHYHELVQVSQFHQNVIPMHMEVLDSAPPPTSEQQDNCGENDTPPLPSIVFTRRFLRGATGKSYGLHVAQWAGLPSHVVQRAQQLLSALPQMLKPKKRPMGAQKSDNPSVFDF